MEQVSVKNDWLRLQVLNYGAIIQRLEIRASDGSFIPLVVGLDNPESYLNDQAFLGACVGRFAGRISGGQLQVGGQSYPLSHTDGITLHGGERGFGKRYWTIEAVNKGPDGPEIRLAYESPHGEEGFPGNLGVALTYRLEGNTLVVSHQAETDRTTVVNLANHSYFKTDSAPGIGKCQLQLGSSRYLETDGRLLPTGRILDVAGTPYDFRNPRELEGTQLDTPYILDPASAHAAEWRSPESGVRLRVQTNQPAMVVYTPPHFPAICFETQGYPDAPNHEHFPSTLLEPGRVYRNESRFTFDFA